MVQPLIGITTHRSATSLGVPLFSTAQAYVEAIARAGGAPVLLPLGLDKATLFTLTSRLDGILFSGGGDIQPELYGSQSHPKVNEVDHDRDRVELWLVQRVLQRKLPFLGICRGLQVINVGLGGSLYEDILDQHPSAQQHQFSPGHPRNHLAHTVQVQAGSRLATILGAESFQVNSLHHQGVRKLAPALQANAFAPDGILEGLEIPDHPFGMAVQWHPEWLRDDPVMQRIFRAFILAATGSQTPDQSVVD
jgi:putative glutamine amidotransferase